MASRHDLLTFIETRGFTDAWARLKLTMDALVDLQKTILVQPKVGSVVSGTGGLRKMRFSPREWRTGKRGALRILYVLFDAFGVVLLVFAYSKTEIADFSAGQRGALRDLIERQRNGFARRSGK